MWNSIERNKFYHIELIYLFCFEKGDWGVHIDYFQALSTMPTMAGITSYVHPRKKFSLIIQLIILVS